MSVEVLGVRADNPGMLTLTGTNTWIVDRDPCWVVDPGPALEDHLAAVLAACAQRGGAAGIVLTHDHSDHAEGAADLAARLGGVELHAARLAGAGRIAGGERVGPFEALATPGHAPDHLAYVVERVCFTGDAVLGMGSVFVAPDPGALSGYLAALEDLRARGLERLYPGHGPEVEDPDAHIGSYIAHRREREAKLVAALADGRRHTDELLDAAWAEVPATLRPAAALTLRAHLDKLAEEGRLPDGVERAPLGGPLGQ
jgi:glyoxylase-like metal-dependent hydrolase (beta-lactamase superfamily II)